MAKVLGVGPRLRRPHWQRLSAGLRSGVSLGSERSSVQTILVMLQRLASTRRVRHFAVVLLAGLSVIAPTPPSTAEMPFITLASTTSTQNSGLYRHILPRFTAKTGIAVRVVALGTGAAIRLARGGDADVLLVHHRASEDAFVKDGFGVKRYPLMYNDYVLVGPSSDPARVGHAGPAIASALRAIAASKAPFTSRGDDSGTHKRELELWERTRIDPQRESGTWYRETGSGMGATLNTAAAMGAYALTDRASWLGFKNKRDLAVVFEGDGALRNEYGVILVSPSRHSHTKATLGQRFIDWLLSPPGQEAIASFRVAGARLFFPQSPN